MRCNEARDLILEADLDALAGQGPSALARHVRECATCARQAEEILGAEAELGRALARLGPRRSLDEAATRAATHRRRRWLAPVAGLAAAAAIMLLVSEDLRDGLRSGGAVTTAERPPEAVPTQPVLQVPDDRRAVILETRNPAITVIWYP